MLSYFVELDGKTVLVTGAAGFIGSNLVMRLFHDFRNIRVIGVDSITDYYDVNIKYERLKEIELLNRDWTFVRASIADKDAVERIFSEDRISVVVNLAAQAGVRYSITNTDAKVQSNLFGFYNILEACRHYEVEHLVYASSSSVYGSNKTVPYSTDDKVDNPVSLYAATKKSNELKAHAYSKLYNIPSTGLRFFTVYGPAGRPDMAYFGFTDKLVKGETIKIFNYGNCKRDFTYVDDIVEGVVRGMHHAPEKGANRMADYQEYRRRILHRRWRRVFIIVALLALLALLSAIGILWKVLHRERVDTALSQNTILRQVTTDNTWNTVSYPLARQLRVQTLEDSTETALDFRMAALPASAPVEKSWFSQVSFVGDSLTQGLQIYDTGLPGAQFCAYKGVGPNAFVNGTSCKRVDGVTEIPLDALTAQQPKAVYVLLGSNVLGQDTDYTSFLTYYRLMLDMISQALPDAKIYVQSITPVRPEVSAQANHAGLNRDRLCHINNELAAIALEKDCYFLNLWEVLADENGALKADYAPPDGYHLTPEGYTAWVDYLCSHTAG